MQIWTSVVSVATEPLNQRSGVKVSPLSVYATPPLYIAQVTEAHPGNHQYISVNSDRAAVSPCGRATALRRAPRGLPVSANQRTTSAPNQPHSTVRVSVPLSWV